MMVLKRLVLILLVSSVVLLVLSISIYERVTRQVDKTENLIGQLQSFDWDQRKQAAEALSQIGDDRAFGPLVIALKDDDSDVRQKAAQALDKLGWQPENEDEQRLYFIAKKDWGKYVELDCATVEALIMVLRDKNPEIRKKATRAIGQIQNPAIKPLVAALRDDNYKVREKAAQALIKTCGVRAVPLFIAALRDEHPYAREKAAEALGRIGDKRAVKPLVAALNDVDWQVREKAAQALSLIGDDSVFAPLAAVLKDDDSDVRQKAAQSLEQLGWQPENEDEQRLYFIAKKDWGKYVELDCATVEALIMVLSDKNPEIRKRAIETLIKLGGRRTVGPLIGALEYADEDIQKEAAGALGRIGDKRAVNSLIVTLKDMDPDVRQAASRALVEMGGLYAMGPLIDALKNKDKDSNVREAAAEILGKISHPAVKPLVSSLWDEDWDVREEAAKTLGKLGDRRAVNPLIAVLKYKDAYVPQKRKRDIYERTNHIPEPSVAPFMNHRNHLCIEVIKALGQIGDERAIPILVEQLQSWYTAQAAADALGKFNWSPQSNKDKVHFLIAKKDGNTLRDIWDQAKLVLLNDIKSREDTVVKNALYTFIAIGKQEIIKELIDTLNTKGYEAIAKVYHNCGNKELKNAAQAWAAKHQVYINIDSDPHLVNWSSW